ncbi:MAG: DUF4148 domain-containing protein [Oxalobacteraceae bacterium]|nr:DUF4148 domain-containing protein [Oxalobacteraceae bacterium]
MGNSLIVCHLYVPTWKIKMKKALLLLALVQGIALSAHAQTATPMDGSKTRTEVKAETKAANKAGELNTGGNVGVTNPAADVAGTKVRADVKAEAKAANKAGELKGGNVTPMAPVPKSAVPAGGKSRTEVKAEARAANKAGELSDGNIGALPAPVVKKAVKPAGDATAK